LQVQIIQPSDQAGVSLSTELADSDLLTQAMTELTQSFGTEFRLVTANTGSEFQTVVPCIVSVADPSLAASGPLTVSGSRSLDAGSNVMFSHPAVGQVVQRMPGTGQILHTVPKTVSSTLYPLSYINAGAVAKNLL